MYNIIGVTITPGVAIACTTDVIFLVHPTPQVEELI